MPSLDVMIVYCPTLFLLFRGVVMAWWYGARVAGEEQGRQIWEKLSTFRFFFATGRGRNLYYALNLTGRAV